MNFIQDVYEVVCWLFFMFWDGKFVCCFGVNLFQFLFDDIWQFNLFQDYVKKMSFGYVMDGIKSWFGDIVIIRVVLLIVVGQVFECVVKIGGYYK